MAKHKRHVQRSIFLKLFFVLLMTGVTIMLLVGFFFRQMFSEPQQEIIKKNAENYAHYVIAEIGDPPDTVKAKQFASEYGVIIYYKGDKKQWSSSADFNPFQKHGFRKGHLMFGWSKNIYIVSVHTDKGLFVFGLKFVNRAENHELLVFLLLVSIAMVIAILHVSIRRILRPLKGLNEGVRQISQGNFNHQVPVWKPDQLGELTDSFNSMTKKIKEMILARDQLLLDVSHEMRSPLTRVKMAMEFLPDDANKESIREDINELEQMLAEILETERLNSAHQSLKLEKVNITRLVHDLAQKFSDIKPGLDLSGLPESCFVQGDTERLKMCIRNVIENSLKFSAESANPVRIMIETQDAHHVLKIRDNGQGIPESDLSFIFEPFYRVDKSRSKKTGGYGLGMSLCKKIIEVHKGTIKIESEVGKGTTVIISLPQ